MRIILVVALCFYLLSGHEAYAQNRKITEWRQDPYRVVIATIDNQQRWAEMSRRILPFELPAIIRGLDRKNYILSRDGHWMLEREFVEKAKVSYQFIGSDSTYFVNDDQIIETENETMLVSFAFENGFDNIKLVAYRDQKAVNQAYSSNATFTQFPRNQAKTSVNANLQPVGSRVFYTVELAMCENGFSVHLPSGEKLFGFTVVRTLPKQFLAIESGTSKQGIFVPTNQFRTGESILISQRVAGEEIIYDLENPNPFDVEVQLGFGSEYNVKYPPALNNKQFGHPVSMDFGFKAARTDKAIIKANQKVENIRVFLDKCEYARNPFSLSVSSVRPVTSSD